MKNLELVSKYPEIFSSISKWKTLELKDLYHISEFDHTYDHFKRVIRNMQKNKLIDSTIFGSNGQSKVVYSYREIMKSLNSQIDYQINYATIMHDAIVAKVILTLQNEGLVENFKLPHEYSLIERFKIDLSKVEPDAIFTDSDGSIFLLEVELSQKDFARYKRKWSEFLFVDTNAIIIYLVPTLSIEKSLLKNIDRFCSAISIEYVEKYKVRERIKVISFKGLTSLKNYEQLAEKLDFIKKV